MKADRVRWSYDDLEWNTLKRELATPDLVHLIRNSAQSEMTTYSATMGFMRDFAGDPDFTQWISVWFYEETRHPHILLTWLKEVTGEVPGPDFYLKGRATAPFMKSKMGNIVNNIISEMVAASNYRNLATLSPEPLLSKISFFLSQDEERHAASFYSYGKRMFEQSQDPERDKRDALKVLYMWIQEEERVKHPVNSFLVRESEVIEQWLYR